MNSSISLDYTSGLRLPRCAGTWKETHAYFLSYPPLADSIIDIDECTEQFQKNIYNYLRDNSGLHRPSESRVAPPVWNMNASNRVLCKRLRNLKEKKEPIFTIFANTYFANILSEKHPNRVFINLIGCP